MKFERTKISIVCAHALGIATLVAATTALAQDVTPPADNKIKVEVVGSGIKRSLEDQSLPVQVLTRDDIQRSGVQNMEQLVQKITATATAGATSGASLATAETFGQSSVSLRGLGAKRTLILLDGQRIAPFAQELSNGVDINAIPISAIERVEVLTDGASSVYGSDAVAGVINFILRRNFTGMTMGYEHDEPTQGGGGRTENFWVSGGYGDLVKDRFNVTLSYQYKKESSLLASERDFSKSGNVPPFYANSATPSGRIEGTWVPGSDPGSNNASATNPFGISTSGYGNPGADSPGCAAMGMFAIPNKPRAGTGTNCNFDSAPFVELFPQVETNSGVGTFNFQLTPQAQLYLTGLYTQNKVKNEIQASPARIAFFQTDPLFASTPGVDQALLIYPGNPNYPHAWLQSHGLAAMDGQVLAVSLRAFAAGARQEFDTNTQQQYVAGVKGTWLKDWDYDVNAQYSKSESKGALTGGFFSQVGLARAWNTVGNTPGSYVDPWAVGGVQNPTLTAAIQAANYNGPTSTAGETLNTFQAKTSGTLYEMAAGPLAASFGFAYLKGKYTVSVPDILASGDISGLGGAIANQDGDRTVTAGYAEFAIPVTRDINLNLSTRLDHYDDLKADNTPWTGKVSATWQPWQWGMFRASYGTGFRAPTLGELHGPVILGTSEQFIDPLFADQGPIQANAFIGGNPDLKPEKSKQGSVGFVWTPVRTFTSHIDYWEIKIDKYITTPSALAMVNAARAGSFIFTPNEVSFAPDGEVDTVNEVSQNAAKAHFSGIDGAASWRQPTAWGTWGVDYSGTYYLKADLETAIGTEHNIGTIVDPNTLVPLQLPIGGGVIVRYKQTVSANWSYRAMGRDAEQQLHQRLRERA